VKILRFNDELLPMLVMHLRFMLKHIPINRQLRLLYQSLIIIRISEVIHTSTVNQHCYVEEEYCLNHKRDHCHGRSRVKVWEYSDVVMRGLAVHDNAEIAQEKSIEWVEEEHRRVEKVE